MNEDELSNNGEWKEWRRLIIYELKRFDKIQDESQKTIIRLQKDISRIGFWSGMFGAIGGILATMLLWSFLG